MKSLIAIFLLMITAQMGFGQACGIYRVKYVGEIVSENVEIIKVKLPTIPFLHEKKGSDLESKFVELKTNGNHIEKEVSSHITSKLYSKADTYLKLYQSKREKLPIKFVILEEGKETEITIELYWDEIEIREIEDEGFGRLFEINLKEIKVENN
jgi:hypothetical protein